MALILALATRESEESRGFRVYGLNLVFINLMSMVGAGCHPDQPGAIQTSRAN